MKLSRRGFAGFAAALPFAGNAVAEEMAAKQRDAMFANRGLGGGTLGVGIPESYGVNPAPAPKMEHWQAMRLALKDPDIKRAVLDQLYHRHKVVLSVDPDINVLRSVSPMAKIAYQRQRNVERELEQMASNDGTLLGGFPDLLGRFIKKAMWGD